MKKIPIIALAHTVWDGRWMNRQHILSRLGERDWPIIYSNGAPYTWELKQHIKDTGITAKVEHKDQVTIFTPGLCTPRSQRLTSIDKIAINQHCSQLKRAAGIKNQDEFMVICFDPDFYPYIEALNPRYTAVHMYDVYNKIGNVNEQFNNQLKNLLIRADLITASTQYLLDVMASDHEEKSHVVFNSADYQSISTIKKTFVEPKKLNNITRPRIGYLGAINRKMDFKCILESVENNPQWQWVFMGPINETEIHKGKHAEAYEKIRSLPNTHFIGEIERSQIPYYLSSMDVNILCLRTDDDSWSKHSYPLKLNEYLATGLPIVSTALPVVQKECGDLIYFAESAEQWQKQLAIAIDEKEQHRRNTRKEFARANSWDYRVTQFESLLSEITEARLNNRASLV